jgi:hypothetical protein
MLPLTKFSEILREYKHQFNEDFDELIAASDLLGARPNYLIADENGQFYFQTTGSTDECIRALEAQLDRLKRIKTQSRPT